LDVVNLRLTVLFLKRITYKFYIQMIYISYGLSSVRIEYIYIVYIKLENIIL